MLCKELFGEMRSFFLQFTSNQEKIKKKKKTKGDRNRTE